VSDPLAAAGMRAEEERPTPSVAGTWQVLRRGWRTSPELRQGARLTILLALLGGGGRVVVPILIQQLLDRGLKPGADEDVLWGLAGAGVVVVALTALAAATTKRRLALAGEAALSGLRVRAFRHIHRLSLATQTDERRGALVSRVTSDVETLSQFVSWGGITWLVNGMVMASVLIVMSVYDWRLTVVAVLMVLPMVLILRVVQRRLTVAYALVRERVGVLLGTVGEAVLGAPVIRAYGAAEHSNGRAREAVETSRDANIRAGTLAAYMFPAGDVFSVLTVAAVLWAGIEIGPAGGLTAGRLVAFIFLVLLFLEPVADFTEIVDQTQTAVAGWRRVLDVIDTPVEVRDPDPGVALPAGPPEIRIEHVDFAYTHGDRPVLVLHDVTCTIPAGARVALVGATGSGKTTLAKLLVRLADPTSGRITIAGVDLRDVSASSRQSALVMVPQEGFLFDTTVGENVRFGHRHATEEEIERAFTELGLGSWLNSLPRGLATPVGQRGEHLSVGERQLVSLARASVANPACLILDEATSAVDPGTEVRITRAVESLARGRTSITIAHRLATAERADAILVLADGRLVEHGSHAELIRRGGAYATLHDRWVAGVQADPITR
jgi:putative ABC transport system ATP-binding protein